MKRNVIVLLSLILAPASLRAADQNVLKPEVVAPGLMYAQYHREGLIAHVLRMELKSKTLRLRSVKARGRERVREMVARVEQDDTTLVVGAINGDFFRDGSNNQGIPYGVQVCDGSLVFAPMQRSMIAFGPENEPYIGIVSLRAKITLEPKARRSPIAKWDDVAGVNTDDGQELRSDGVFLFTPSFLGFRPRRANGLVAVIDELSPGLTVGEVCEGKVSRVLRPEQQVEVPEAGCLLFFSGTALRKHAGLAKQGAVVALKLELPPIAGGVSQAIGGGPRLVRDGKRKPEFDQEDFGLGAGYLAQRHPRTAIGFDKAKKTLFLVTVEGRHQGSRGMTFGELAGLLADLGCWQAMAFDGGGSSGMYVGGGKGMVSHGGGGAGAGEDRELANGLVITMPRFVSKPPAESSGSSGKSDVPAKSEKDPRGDAGANR